jgi:7-cyano-7-deazaguanine synthase
MHRLPFAAFSAIRAAPLSRQAPHRSRRAVTATAPPPAPPADVVLLSGGVESSALLATLTGSAALLPLHLAYSQRAAPAELAASQRQVLRAQRLAPAAAPVADLLTLDISSAGASLRGLNPRRRAHIPLPHRNLPLLALAVSAASAARAAAGTRAGEPSALYIALSADDAAWYPSAGGTFLAAFRALADVLEPGLAVRAPFDGMGKAEVVRVGAERGVNWADTYSCMLGGGGGRAAGELFVHCGRCAQCVARRRAFCEAGVADGTHGRYRR